MTWTTPKTTYAVGELVGISDLNNIGNNLTVLYTPARAAKSYKSGSTIQTNSTSFVALDTTNLAMSVTIKKTQLGIIFVGFFGQNGGGTATFDISINGTRLGDASNGIMQTTLAYNSYLRVVPWTATGLTPGVQTIQLWAKHSAGGAAYAAVFTETVQMIAWEL